MLYLPNVTLQSDGYRLWIGKRTLGQYGLGPGDVVDVHLGDVDGNADDVNCTIDDEGRVMVRKKVIRSVDIEPGDEIDVHLEVAE